MSDYPSDDDVERWMMEADGHTGADVAAAIVRRAIDWYRKENPGPLTCTECDGVGSWDDEEYNGETGRYIPTSVCCLWCDGSGYEPKKPHKEPAPTIADKPSATRETTHLLAVDKEPDDLRNPWSKIGPRTPPADVLAAENADLRRQLAALAQQCGPSCAAEILALRVRAEAAEARVAELEEAT